MTTSSVSYVIGLLCRRRDLWLVYFSFHKPRGVTMHVFKVGVQLLGLGYCTEQHTDGIPSFVHCSLQLRKKLGWSVQILGVRTPQWLRPCTSLFKPCSRVYTVPANSACAGRMFRYLGVDHTTLLQFLLGTEWPIMYSCAVEKSHSLSIHYFSRYFYSRITKILTWVIVLRLWKS